MSRATRRAVSATAAALVLLTAVPAHAANPVLDPEDDADLAASLADATEVQGVCYGYLLQVSDQDTGQWGGTFAASSLGAGVPAARGARCPAGAVQVVARISYVSEWSEAEDSADWTLTSDVEGLSVADLQDLGLSAGDLLDDGRSATTLSSAVLALPRLAAEQAGLPPVVLEPDDAPLPEGAAPTGSPGSDWLRENLALLGLCVAAIAAGLVVLVASWRGSGSRATPPPGAARGPYPAQPPTSPWSTSP